MKWFLNATTRAKLIISFGAMIVLLGVVSTIAYLEVRTIQTSERRMFEETITIVRDLLELKADANRTRSQMLGMMLSTVRSDQDAYVQEIRTRSQKAEDTIQGLVRKSRDDPAFFNRLDELQAVLAEYRQTRNTQISLIYEGRIAEARELGLGIQFERFERIRAIIVELGDVEQRKAEAAVALSAETADTAIRYLIIMGGFALLVSVGMVILMTRIIATPLMDLTVAAEQIAAGDLSGTVSSNDRQDEVGLLAQSFSRMIQSLQVMASAAEQIANGDLTVRVTPRSDRDALGTAFKTMVESLRNQIQEIGDGINVLTSSSSEIMSFVSQLSMSASETATSISETTTTVEEVRQTAEMANEKAKEVSENGQKMTAISQSGAQSIQDTIQGMSSIQEQMTSIAETVMRLSEQSQVIGEITTTVMTIAEQSNLLAVNASIEAAKAGEQGRGFAVVAREIKNLSDQSKRATAQVRSILDDVQKAINTAVMVTEQGGKAVDAGVQLSVEAGESIRMLSDSITEAAQVSIQIASSGQQQFVGMDQVEEAMGSIREASAQTADGTRQTESAVNDLREVGTRLQDILKRYKVS